MNGTRGISPKSSLALSILLLLAGVAEAQIAAPSFFPPSAYSSGPAEITISETTPGAVIHFTLDGTDPTTISPSIGSGSAVTVLSNELLKANAWSGATASPITYGTELITSGAVEGGADFGVAMKWNGLMYSWGYEANGRIGNGSTAAASQLSPGRVSKSASVTFDNAIGASSGYTQSLIVDSTGAAWAFGTNTYGELGTNSTTASAYAVQVHKSTVANDFLKDISQVSAGTSFSLALGADGTVWSWGLKTSGRLGYGTATGNGLYAVRATGLTSIATISAGNAFGMALDDSGNVWAWGDNNSGQLGNGNVVNQNTAAKVQLSGADLAGVTAISSGWNHAAAVRWDAVEQGTVWCWGQQANGRLGNNTSTTLAVMTPTKVQTATGYLSNVVQVAAGPWHTLALDANGGVWAWGDNQYGNLGDNTIVAKSHAIPITVPGLPVGAVIVGIGVGGYQTTATPPGVYSYSYAIDSLGNVYSWGYNGHAELADGNTTNQHAPVLVPGLDLQNQAPTVSLAISPSTPQFQPATFTLTATPADLDKNLTQVQIIENGSIVQTLTASPWVYSAASLPAGSYSFTAVATDSAGLSATSGIVSATVTLAAVSVTASPTSISEGGSNTVFTLTRTGPTTAALTVHYAVSGTATNGVDYATLSGVATIATGQTTSTVSVGAFTDTVYDPNETLVVTVTPVAGVYAAGTPASATVTIKDTSSVALAKYQADTGFVVTSGKVNWNDQSGRANNAIQNTVAAAPTLVSNVLNGKPVVHFGGSQYLTLPNLQAGTTYGEIIAVLRTANSTVNTGLWKFGASSAGDYYTGASGSPSDDFGSSSRYLEAHPIQDLTHFHIYEVSGQAGLWESLIDGIPLTTSRPNTFAASTTPWLGENSAGAFFNGDIAEVLIFNRPLSESERDAARSYLAGKYALFAAPPAPTGLQANALTPSTALLTWNAGITNALTSFVVSRQENGGAWSVAGTVTNANTFMDNGLDTAGSYVYTVQAVNDAAAGGTTAPVALARTLPFQGPFPTSGIQLWLMADGAWESPVGYLADYSGMGHDAYQGTLANMPTVVTSTLNGKPVLHFSGSQFLSLPDLLSGSAAAEVTVVLRDTAGSHMNNALWRFGTASSGAYYTGADGSVTDDFGSSTRSTETPRYQDLSQYHIYEVSSQSNLWQSWLDGAPFYSTSANIVSFSTAPLLGENSDGAFFTGDVAEIIVHNRVLSEAERQTLRQYLDAKYLFPGFDLDNDGLTNAQELALGSNPYNPDTNGDGIPDGLAYWSGLPITGNDVDFDGLTTAQELAIGTNPFSADTDRDGVPDAIDFYPLDPTRSAAPGPSPSAPTITLTSPAGVPLLP